MALQMVCIPNCLTTSEIRYVDQTMHLVELTDEELKEILNALEVTANEGLELSSSIYHLMNKLPEPSD